MKNNESKKLKIKSQYPDLVSTQLAQDTIIALLDQSDSQDRKSNTERNRIYPLIFFRLLVLQ